MIRKRLFYDIETSYYLVKAWSPGYNRTINPQDIIKFPAVICVCWKWEGEDEIHSLTWDGEQSDKELLEKFVKELHKANQIIAHNGDRFDLKWLRMRAIKHDLWMFPRYETVDTLKIAKSQFRFHSNKLDELGKFLGVGEKIETNMALWDKIIMDKDPEALEEMVKYCKQDVALLEKVYNKLKSYSKVGFNYGKLYGDDNWSCPECGNLKVHVGKVYTTPMGVRRYYLRCKTGGCLTNYPVSNRTYLKMMKWKNKNNH